MTLLAELTSFLSKPFLPDVFFTTGIAATCLPAPAACPPPELAADPWTVDSVGGELDDTVSDAEMDPDFGDAIATGCGLTPMLKERNTVLITCEWSRINWPTASG